MDVNRVGEMTLALTALPSRRDTLRGLAAAGLSLGYARAHDDAEARKKHKHKKKDKKPKLNAFGCVNVGGFCKNSDQCCSGLCEGKKGKRKCVGHNAGICNVNFDLCTTGTAHYCNASNGLCACALTTGNAGFCADFTGGAEVLCRDCSQDTDCQEEFGPGAACLDFGGICTDLCPDTGTACAPPCA